MEQNISLVKKIGNFVSNILLGETKEIIIRTDVRVNGLEGTIKEIKEDIRFVRENLGSHREDIASLKVYTGYGVSKSPTIPNDMGKKLLTDSGFFIVYPKLKDKLFTLMDTMNLRTPYDYEVGAIKALNKLERDPLIDLMKNYALNNPNKSLELIFKVASWVIRDDYTEYLKERK